MRRVSEAFDVAIVRADAVSIGVEVKAEPPANSGNLTREGPTVEAYTAAIARLICEAVSVTTPKIPPTLPARLRHARERAALSMYRLAELSGAKPWQIRTWELDPSDPRSHRISPDNLARLLPHIGGTSDYYFYGVKDGAP